MSTSTLKSLVVKVSELRPFSSNFVQLALCSLSFSLIGGLLVSSSSFNHSSWLQCNPWLLRPKDLV